MIYQNNNHTPWAFVVIVVLSAFILLGVLIKDKYDTSPQGVSIPVTGYTNEPAINAGGSAKVTDIKSISPTQVATATPTRENYQSTLVAESLYLTRTAAAQSFSTTATIQAIAIHATEVYQANNQTQAALRITEQAQAIRLTQDAQYVENQEKSRVAMVTQTAEALRFQSESSQEIARAIDRWVNLGLKIAIGIAALAIGIGIASGIQANSYEKKQLALAKNNAERRRLLEVQMTVRKNKADGITPAEKIAAGDHR